MRTTVGWGADGAATALQRMSLERRDLRPDDIAVRVDHCGVCHTDLHALNARSGGDALLVPGHEFTGVVTGVGAAVTRFGVGDPVAVGNIVDSCGKCTACRAGEEQFCAEYPTTTYGGRDRIDGSTTLGGYAREYVLRERFAYPLPEALDPAAAAPLLCAGITVWEPLHSLGVGKGSRVAVAGLGGLGHLAVKFAVALGAETTVVSRTADKADDARRLGADIDTVSASHDLGPYLALVAMDGTLSQVGHLGPVTVETLDLLVGRKKLSSAGSGGRPATAAMLDFCAEHGITADVEVLPSSRVAEALDRLRRNDVRYRFVLDLSDLD
jgi:uncharacterized zinc-type alcohol dehydrogenase-like protein